MFHITLDAAGNILRVHYKSMKCDVSFSQVVYVCYLGEVDIFYVCVKILFLLTAVQKLFFKSNEFFPSYDQKSTATLFYETLCVIISIRSTDKAAWPHHDVEQNRKQRGRIKKLSKKLFLTN